MKHGLPSLSNPVIKILEWQPYLSFYGTLLILKKIVLPNLFSHPVLVKTLSLSLSPSSEVCVPVHSLEASLYLYLSAKE